MSRGQCSVAVILCSYDIKRLPLLKEAIESLLNQTRQPDEIVAVISSSKELKDAIEKDYSGKIKIVFSEISLSATRARNRGIAEVKSEIIAFTDDDIVADRDWIKNLLSTYESSDALAVGGKILPSWMTGEPDHLPEELYWLVGAVHQSYLPDEVKETRNVFGPNMSFRGSVFRDVGLFDESLGFADSGNSYVQGEEPEFGLRMLHKLGRGTVYNPAAIIFHKVPAEKLKLNLLFKRSFYQGYTKAIMDRYAPPSSQLLGPEKTYLGRIARYYLPLRVKGLFTGKARLPQLKKLYVLLVSVACVGAGFFYGKTRRPRVRAQHQSGR